MPDPLDLDAFKARAKAMWMAGDYAEFATLMAPGARRIVDEWRIAPGSRVLDVACGAGQAALHAARAGAIVTGLDFAPSLLERARRDASAEGLSVRFDEGDAEALPYADASFDVVISLIGVMFAPRPERAGAELLRVCRPGGRVLLSSWTPEGMVGELFRWSWEHAPPPPGVPPPVQWGDEAFVRRLLGPGLRSMAFRRAPLAGWTFPFEPPGVAAFFERLFGPVQRAFAAAGPAREAGARAGLEDIFRRYNVGPPGVTTLNAELLLLDGLRA